MCRFPTTLCCNILLALFFLSIVGPSSAGQGTPATVTIHQVHEVLQGEISEFEITIPPEDKTRPITLRLKRDVGIGKAVFEDGSTEMVLHESGSVYIRGITSSDLPGELTLSAWPAGAQKPAATVFFDIFPPTPEPRIFFDGLDVTGTRQAVTVGQLIQLTVVPHPGLPIQSQDWSIGNPGDYTGGFLHTPFQGGPQPVVRKGSTTRFYWITPGESRVVTYQLKLTNGLAASAEVIFDVDGPSSAQVEVDSVKVVLVPATPNSSLLGLTGSGISFRAAYSLPDGMLKNFTWVQLIQSDVITVDNHGAHLRCVPKSLPMANFGAGLDTIYPYDTHNPTLDNPRIQFASEIREYSRLLHARMYLLWSSGLSNSIEVPLGFVDWSFSGEVALKDAKANAWVLKSGHGGPNNPAEPFKRSHAYPFWNSLVPYTEVLTCN